MVVASRQEQEGTTSNFAKLAYVQIFKLGLCVNLNALAASISNKKKLDKEMREALPLYQCALKINTDNSSDLQLSRMVVNNLGHIHATLNNASFMQDCFLNLLELLDLSKKEITRCTTNDENNNNITMSMNGQRLDDAFMGNIFTFLLFPSGCVLAAAA